MREDDGGTLTVTEVTFNPTAPTNLTYNLDVAITNTYFVGNDGVLVHNGRGKDIVTAILLTIGLQDPSTPKLDFNPEFDPRGRAVTISVCPNNTGTSPPGGGKKKYSAKAWRVRINKIKYRD